jgi:hypothetical protein
MKVLNERLMWTNDLNMKMSVRKGYGKCFREIGLWQFGIEFLSPVTDQWWIAGNKVMRLRKI